MNLTPGTVLNKRYRIVSLLGEGGFGAVYKAWDLNLNGPCAVKENKDATHSAQSQFEREATMLAGLRHPNLPRVTDHFFIPEQGQYLVMDYIQGDNLEELLAKSSTPLTPEQALDWTLQICDALSYLHTRPQAIIHRDIKPANIKITPDGRAMLVDFGIAKVYDEHLKTTAGARAVTPGYSPPEQYGFGKTDHRSDIYALGATLYKALTLQDPPESVERTIGGALTNPTRLNHAVPPWLETVILQAMQTTPTNRFQTVAELRSALLNKTLIASTTGGAATAQYPLVSPVITQVAPTGVGGGRKTLPAWLWIVLAAVLGLGTVGVLGLVMLLNNNNNLHATQTAAALARAESRTAEAERESRPTATPNREDEVAPLATTPVPVVTEPPPEPAITEPPAQITSTFTPTPSLTPTATFTPTQTPQDLSPFIIDPFNVPMALVPAGTFIMGGDADYGYQACLELYTNNTSECTRSMFEDADYVHSVYLSSYYIDQYEVTNQSYAGCVAAGACSAPVRNISKTRGDYYNDSRYADYPVIYVTWDMAQDYCAWRGGRLPTEAEWERAARGDDGRIFPWGNFFDGSLLNFCDANCTTLDSTLDWFNPAYNDGYADTSPVGTYGDHGHPFGLYDLGGNVWEWVYDWYERNYYETSPAENPMGPATGTDRGTRGGSIANTGYVTITYYRDISDPTGAFWNVGFRCVVLP